MTQTTVPFTATGTWVAPDGVTTAQIECWGGGGGGGAGTANPGSGGGGAGGAYARTSVVQVVPGTAYTITVAAATSSAAGAGVTGGTSSFGAFTSGEYLTQDQVDSEAALAWVGVSGVTATRDSTHARSGTWAVKAVSDGTANSRWTPTAEVTTNITAGDVLLFQAWVWSTLTTQIRIEVDWHNSADTYLSTTVGTNITPTASTWNLVTVTGTAPATATRALMILKPNSVVAGNTWWSDDHSVTEFVPSVAAVGGAGGAVGSSTTTGGAGGTGTSTGCIGDIVFAGGSGSAVNTDLGGAAGGAGAGSTAAGANASASTGGTGANGGGSGASGVATSTAGATGTAPGGGGGGGNTTIASDRTGGIGAAGKVVVTYEANVITQSVVQNAAINTANW